MQLHGENPFGLQVEQMDTSSEEYRIAQAKAAALVQRARDESILSNLREDEPDGWEEDSFPAPPKNQLEELYQAWHNWPWGWAKAWMSFSLSLYTIFALKLLFLQPIAFFIFAPVGLLVCWGFSLLPILLFQVKPSELFQGGANSRGRYV